MSSPYAAMDDASLSHALMAVLRWRLESQTGLRLMRGDSPQPIGRQGPRASGALLSRVDERVVVVAEAVTPDASALSVSRAIERTAPLVAYVDQLGSDGASALPAVWICAPSLDCEAIAREHPVSGVVWMPYDVGETEPAANVLLDHERELGVLLARRDAAMQRHREAFERGAQGAAEMRKRVKQFRYSPSIQSATEQRASGLSERYLALQKALRKPGE